MVERESNTIILYPVSDRTAETLITIIERHVQPGSTIYSDGWSAYCNLNNLGYDHFTVLHKYSFKKIYVQVGNPAEKVEVHTNRIEGAWCHAKDHFRKMSETKPQQFWGPSCWSDVAIGIQVKTLWGLLRPSATSVPPWQTPSVPLHYTTIRQLACAAWQRWFYTTWCVECYLKNINKKYNNKSKTILLSILYND